MSAEVKVSTMEEWEKQLMQDPKVCRWRLWIFSYYANVLQNRLALSALSSAAAATILTQRSTLVKDSQTFNVKIPLEGAPITNQRSSGRCWLFASTNVFRVALMRQHNLDEFELSQAYLFFWDKLEKANFFLEQILDTADEDLDGRLVQTLMAMPVGDGGQWDMVANLVEKYGLVPHDLYPDAFAAMNSGSINSVITTKLREDALTLRRLSESKSPSAQSDIAAAKAKMMQEIHLILTLTLGPPPPPDSTFKWEYYSSDKKFHTIQTTPKKFAEELSSPSAIRACSGTDVNRLFSLVNDPRNSCGELLTVNRLGNIVGGRGISYVNTDMTVRPRLPSLQVLN
jgi:bleomycin hydrolase